jgi:protein TonB
VISIESFRRMPPSAAATSGLLHVMILLAIAAQMSPRPPRFDPPMIEIDLQLSQPPPPDVALLPAPLLAPQLAAPDPPPPSPPGPELADILPLPDEAPPITMPKLPRPTLAPVRRAAQPAAPPDKPAPQPQARLRQVREDYLLRVIEKLSRMRYVPRSPLAVDRGVVVTRLTVARDGRLLDAELTHSSGNPDLDNGMMQAIRGAAPFAPLPADIQDDALTITVPISFAPSRP